MKQTPVSILTRPIFEPVEDAVLNPILGPKPITTLNFMISVIDAKTGSLVYDREYPAAYADISKPETLKNAFEAGLEGLRL